MNGRWESPMKCWSSWWYVMHKLHVTLCVVNAMLQELCKAMQSCKVMWSVAECLKFHKIFLLFWKFSWINLILSYVIWYRYSVLNINTCVTKRTCESVMVFIFEFEINNWSSIIWRPNEWRFLQWFGDFSVKYMQTYSIVIEIVWWTICLTDLF